MDLIHVRHLDRRRAEYHHLGLTVLENVVDGKVADLWATEAQVIAPIAGHRLDREQTGTEEAFDEGGAYHHWVIDGRQVRDRIPTLLGFYWGLPNLVSLIVLRPIVLSPYELSAVNVKVYRGGDEQGWHRDTNAVTALLYLTNHPVGTEVEDLDGERRTVNCRAGSLLLMQGRRVRHRVPALLDDAPRRVVVPFNLYHPDDTWRPEGIDEIVYGYGKAHVDG